MRVRPINPDHIAAYKEELFPNEVFAAFNELIAEKYNDGSAKVLQKDVVARIAAKMGDSPNNLKIYANGWLNVEDVYRNNGWKVKYDKAGYCEDYDSFFLFSRK